MSYDNPTADLIDALWTAEPQDGRTHLEQSFPEELSEHDIYIPLQLDKE